MRLFFLAFESENFRNGKGKKRGVMAMSYAPGLRKRKGDSWW